MKINIQYIDNNSFSSDEIIKNTKDLLGKDVKIDITSDNNSPESNIYFGIQNLVTNEQLCLFYDMGEFVYNDEISNIKNNTLKKLEQILDKVIKDNEQKIIG